MLRTRTLDGSLWLPRHRGPRAIYVLGLGASIYLLVGMAAALGPPAATALVADQGLMYTPWYPPPSPKVWWLVLAGVAILVAVSKRRPNRRLYRAGVLCLVLSPFFGRNLWDKPLPFLMGFNWSDLSIWYWVGLSLLPVGWLVLAASVRAARLGAALYVIGAAVYRVGTQATLPPVFRGLWESPELVIFWPVGLWQVVGYALDALAFVRP